MDDDPLGRTQQEIQTDNLYEQHALNRKKASLKFSFSVLDNNTRKSYGSGLSIKDAIAQAVSNAEKKTVAFEAMTIVTPTGIQPGHSFVFSIDPNNPDATRPDVKRITKEDLEVSETRFRDVRNIYRKPVLHHLQYDDSVAHIGEVMESITDTRKRFHQVDVDREYIKGKKPFSLLDPISPRTDGYQQDVKPVPSLIPKAPMVAAAMAEEMSKEIAEVTAMVALKAKRDHEEEAAKKAAEAAAAGVSINPKKKSPTHASFASANASASTTAAATPAPSPSAASSTAPGKSGNRKSSTKGASKRDSTSKGRTQPSPSSKSTSSIPTLPPLHGGHAFASASEHNKTGNRSSSNNNNSSSSINNNNGSARGPATSSSSSNPNSSRGIVPTFVDNKPRVVVFQTKKDGVIADDDQELFNGDEPQQDTIISYEGEDELTLDELSRTVSSEAAYEVLLDHRHTRFHTEETDRPIIPASKSLFLYLDKVRRSRHNEHTNVEDDAESSGDETDLNSFNVNSIGEPSSLCTKSSAYTVGFLSEADLSPRSVYLKQCDAQNIVPCCSVYLGKDFETDLELQHQGIGDLRMTLFAASVVRLSHIVAINIADNNLTDTGLCAIVNAIANMPSVVKFNLSYNTIGPRAALALSTYLSLPSCPLEQLVLRCANIDDSECERFVSALMTNKCLRELDLSENLVGASENLNTVLPDLITGGEALGSLLRSPDCQLQALKVGWNMIRLDGAVNFANSITYNKSLTYLDLSYNALGSRGGIALGEALSHNRTLQTLYLSNNSIDSVACLPLCVGILENTALEYVSFDGNPIGEGGSKAIMLLPSLVGSRVSLTAAACNVLIKDPNCWFDPTDILRKFELYLDNPYDRAVAVFLLCLVAEHHTYQIASSEYYDPATKSNIQLNLVEHVIIDPYSKRLDDHQRDFIANLKVVKAAASNTKKAIELFNAIDTDGSGQLDVPEFAKLLKGVGLNLNEEQIQEIFEKYDVDDSGLIDQEEFIFFLKQELKETEIRLKELVEFPVMSIYTLAGTKEKYVPPRTGILRLSILDGFVQKETYRVINGSDRSYIMRLARESGELIKLATYGIQNCRLRLEDAVIMCETLIKESGEKADVLALVLPQVLKFSDTRIVVQRVLRGNKSEKAKVRREIGNLFKPVMGQSDGYYQLDLSNRLDRVCLSKLLEISMTLTIARNKKSPFNPGVIGDYSQSGNWSCFRNEMYNGESVKVTPVFASPIPKTGKLEFDFVSELRPDKDCYALTDIRFTNMLVHNHLVDPDQQDELRHRLHRSRHCSDKTVHGDGVTMYECPWERAQQIGHHMYQFYANINGRSASVHKYRHREVMRTRMELDPSKLLMTGATFRKYYTIPHVYDYAYEYPSASPTNASTKEKRKKRRNQGESSSGAGGVGLSAAETKSVMSAAEAAAIVNYNPGHHAYQIGQHGSTINTQHAADGKLHLSFSSPVTSNPPPNTFGSDSDSDTEDNAPHRNRSLIENINEREANIMGAVLKRLQSYLDGSPADYANKYLCTMASNNVPHAIKAHRQYEFIMDLFEYQNLFARQLELLLDIFKLYGTTNNSEFFGTYRVELVISLFANVIDLHNFEIVMRALTPYEAACVYCRIGILHLFNPMKPEGTIELDMTRREERIVAKMLAKLSTNEPGENFSKSAFTWERGKEGIGGFVITEPWMTEEGVPKRGVLTLQYYSGSGQGLKGCKPHIKLRKAILQLVFLREEDFVVEDHRELGIPQEELCGEQFMLANAVMFIGYMAYNEAEYKAYMKANGLKHSSHGKRATMVQKG